MQVLNLIKKIIGFIRLRLFVKETLILFQHSKNVTIESKAKIKPATYDNLNDVLNFQASHYLKSFKDFLDDGDKGYFAYIDDKCVHRSWTKTNMQTVYLHPLIPMKLQKDDVFIHWCETAETARGNKIYPYVLSEIAKTFANKKRILICVNERNQPSIKGVKSAGFVPIEVHKLFILCGIKRVRKHIKGSNLNYD